MIVIKDISGDEDERELEKEFLKAFIFPTPGTKYSFGDPVVAQKILEYIKGNKYENN